MEVRRASGSRRPLGRRGLLLLLALVTALHMPRAGECDARELWATGVRARMAPNTLFSGGSASQLRGGEAAGGGQRARGAGAVRGHARKHDSKRFRLPRRPASPGARPLQPDESSLPSSADADVSETATEVLAQELIETKTTAWRSRADASAAVHFGAGVAAGHKWRSDGAHGARHPAFAREVVVEALEEAFGIRSFRDGQEDTISRVLAGNNTLFLSATGSGKSLTYLLPTLLWKRRRVAAGSARAKRGAPAAAKEELKESGFAGGGGGGGGGGETGLTLVVSPLLALIRDQLQHLPPGLKGASLSSDMSSSEQAQVTQLLLSRDRLYFRP
jgi:hypothetical protein